MQVESLVLLKSYVARFLKTHNLQPSFIDAYIRMLSYAKKRLRFQETTSESHLLENSLGKLSST